MKIAGRMLPLSVQVLHSVPREFVLLHLFSCRAWTDDGTHALHVDPDITVNGPLQMVEEGTAVVWVSLVTNEDQSGEHF